MYDDVLDNFKTALESSDGLHFNAKHYLTMHSLAANRKNSTILEPGVQSGKSTKLFLNALQDSERGALISGDIDDCAHVANSSKWTFVRSDSTDIQKTIKEVPILEKGIDILFVDSLHTPEHVQKELYGFYPYVKNGGTIFFDDIDSAPYCEDREMDS